MYVYFKGLSVIFLQLTTIWSAWEFDIFPRLQLFSLCWAQCSRFYLASPPSLMKSGLLLLTVLPLTSEWNSTQAQKSRWVIWKNIFTALGINLFGESSKIVNNETGSSLRLQTRREKSVTEATAPSPSGLPFILITVSDNDLWKMCAPSRPIEQCCILLRSATWHCVKCSGSIAVNKLRLFD